jgi:hypothetical protein
MSLSSSLRAFGGGGSGSGSGSASAAAVGVGVGGIGGGGAHGVLSRPLARAGERSVSGAAFAFLFSELVAYAQSRISTASDLENRLAAAGAGVGARLWEPCCLRAERPGAAPRREAGAVGCLQLLSGPVWAQLFGRAADALERSTDPAHRFAFMIREEDPLCSHFVAMPKELARLNVNAFTAGLVAGMLEAAGFPTQSVQAVTVPAAAAAPAAAAPPPRDGVVYLIVFADAVAARELGA